MNSYDILYSGMSANKAWLEATSNNIANINTTRTDEGGPYKRQNVVFEERGDFQTFFNQSVGSGVQVASVERDDNYNIAYDPSHPDADENGYVYTPAIDITAEMTNMIMAQRGYEANVTALNMNKEVNQKTMEIGKV